MHSNAKLSKATRKYVATAKTQTPRKHTHTHTHTHMYISWRMCHRVDTLEEVRKVVAEAVPLCLYFDTGKSFFTNKK